MCWWLVLQSASCPATAVETKLRKNTHNSDDISVQLIGSLAVRHFHVTVTLG